jgi:Polysaccharide lyase
MPTRLLLKRLGRALSLLGILATSLASAQVTFLSDWNNFGSQFTMEVGSLSVDGKQVEGGPNRWQEVMEEETDRIVEVQDPASPQGGAVLKVQVLPGDNCGSSGERAEVFSMLNPAGAPYPVTIANGHEVYGVAVKVDPNWQPPLHDATHKNTWGIFMQLHSPNAFASSPAIAFNADTAFHLQVLGGDLIGSNGERRSVTPVAFTNGALQQGHWVQFILDVVWAYDDTGSVTVYRKDEGDTKFSPVLTLSGLPTLQFDSQIPNSQNTDPSVGTTYLHYWRAGFYRNDSPGVTSNLWLGPVIRGTSLQVVSSAFGQTIVPNPPVLQ